MKNCLSIFSLFLIIVACDPCDDCDSISFEPTVSFTFINQDSISSIDDSLAIFAFNDSALSVNEDSLLVLRDSLNTVNESISNGGDFTTEKMNLEQWIAERQVDSTFFATKNKDADSLSTVFNAAKTTINSGLLLVDQIEILGANNLITYTDSATTWNVPLSFDGSFTEYEVTIAGITETIELAYENIQEVDEQRNVLIRAENIRVVNTPYDSLINCEENCIDGEASFTFYF
ncbi:hypothetical protein [Ekhidna sp. To15]|uniref:hypothetical protein n=1 Tax=Ekhidna sp. To15 TaxID=3395267 RepID=UPI003F5282AB